MRTPLKLLSLLATASLALSGCGGVYVEQKEPYLPKMDATQEVLQQAVRNDVSVAQSLEGIQGDCAGCEKMTELLQDHSAERSDLLGGLWDPWGKDVPEGAPLPPAVPKPAQDWQELAGQMVKSALADLSAAAQLSEEADRLAAASVATGRLADGLRLARVAGVKPADLEKWMDPIDKPLSGPSELTPEVEADLAHAVRQWDCAAQLIPLYTASQDEDDTAPAELIGRQQVASLLSASTQVLALKVPDQRTQSCVGSFENSAAGKSKTPLQMLENQLMATNLQLFATHPELYLPDVEFSGSRTLPSQMIIDQVTSWSALSPIPATPGVRVSDDEQTVTPAPKIGDYPTLPSPLDNRK